MDGVLIDSEKIWAECENTFLKSVTPDFSENDRHNIIGGSIQGIYLYLKNTYQIDISEKEFTEKYTKFGIENVYLKTNPTNGVIDFLNKVKKEKIPLALASSSYYAWIDTAIDRLDLRKYFQVIFSAEDLQGKGKPAPDLFLETAKQLGILPEKCLVFEDSKNGVLAAKSANMTVYGFRNGVNDEQDLSKADRIFDHFTSFFSQ
jgi:HAD superfamily hydrolase (TIGR01509 family)